MINKENIEPIHVTKNVIKGILYILFLLILAVYFIFFDRSLKLEHTEECPCADSKYTLYQYKDRGNLLERNKYDLKDFKTFKLENRLGFTVDKLTHLDIMKLNDTISRRKQRGTKPFGMQFYWDCKNKEVWISEKHKLSFQ